MLSKICKLSDRTLDFLVSFSSLPRGLVIFSGFRLLTGTTAEFSSSSSIISSISV